MKRKTFSVLLALVLALSLSLVTAVPAGAQTTLNVIPYTLSTGTNAAAWSTVQKATGTHSVLLNYVSGDNSYVEFTPATGTTVNDLAGITDGWSWWYYASAAYGPILELHFSAPGSGHVDITVDTAEVSPVITTGTTEEVTSASTCIYFGNDDTNQTSFSDNTGSVTLAGVLASINAQQALLDHTETATAWELTRVRAEIGWSAPARTCYIDDIEIAGVTYYGHIGNTIAIASAGDTITVAAGTYDENVDVDKSLTLTGVSSATVTVGAAGEDNVFDVTASSVTISGFTVNGANVEIYPHPVVEEFEIAGYAGIYLSPGVTDCNIHDNILTGNVYGILLLEAEDTVTPGNNTFTSNTATVNVISGIEMQHTYGNTFTSNTADDNGKYGITLDSSRGNTFTGNTANSNDREGFWLKQGQGLVGSNYNTFTDNTANANTYSGVHMTNLCGDSTYTGNTFNDNDIAGMNLGGTAGDATSNLTVNNNTFSGNVTGILIDTGAVITDVVLRNNSIVLNTTGITVKADASGVTVNYNEITGNTAAGVQNDDTGVELDAQYNWWGGVAGPFHANNPYESEADSQSNDAVSNDVDFLPWMIHDTLVSGWNIWSTPIAAATGYEGEPDTNTVEEALDFWDADSSKVIDAYYFDSSTQAWVVPPSLTPLQAVYLNLSASATIDVCVSDSNYAPPGRTMHLGWNLVGTADWDDNKLVNVALDAAFYGTGAVNLEGYQYVISPSIHQTAWTFTRGGTATAKYFVPTEGYWVYMVNQGVLNGFTYTPITP